MFARIVFVAILLTAEVSAQFYLDKSPNIDALGQTDSQVLCDVARNTAEYLNNNSDDRFAVHAGRVFNDKISLTSVQETLAFLCQIAKEDLTSEQNRLNDIAFLRENFEFYRWLPDRKTAREWADKSDNAVKQRLLNNIPEDQLFITKYYTKLLTASSKPTATYSQALYGLPFDEVGLSQQQADSNPELTRHQFTRQQAINGALKGLAPPLLWLTEDALHDVLLQGTGVVDVDGQRRYFNVHRNNGIAYNYSLGKSEQARYWYFAEVPSILGYGQTLATKIPIKPYATFAGNVKSLGLGKLFYTKMKTTTGMNGYLGVLADQGGAFDGNLFQLDFLVGSYFGWQDYYAANKHFPDYAETWLLIKK
ncbi:MltA domain-containing protein [Thalassotalea fusca]